MQNYDKEVERLLEQVRGYLYARIAALASEGVEDFTLVIHLQPKPGAMIDKAPVTEDPNSLSIKQQEVSHEIPQNPLEEGKQKDIPKGS